MISPIWMIMVLSGIYCVYGFSYYALFKSYNIFNICIFAAFLAFAGIPFRKFARQLILASTYIIIYGSAFFTGGLVSPVLFWLLPVLMSSAYIGLKPSKILTLNLLSLALMICNYSIWAVSSEVPPEYNRFIHLFALVGILVSGYLFIKKEQNLVKENIELQSRVLDKEKYATIGQIAAGVAHEINTPIHICLMAISDFRESVQSMKSDFIRDNVSMQDFENFLKECEDLDLVITESLKRCGSLTKEFKLVSSNYEHEKSEEIELHSYLASIARSLSPLLKDGQHQIKVEVGEALLVYTYPSLISQVIANIVNNAAVHAFPERKGGQIVIKAAREGSSICIDICDDGVGIPVGIREKIFTPFFTTKPGSGGGTGLGLSVVEGIIKNKLKGTIVLKESLTGTQFSITFPSGTQND